jgi:hypothetical protein
MLYIVSTYNLIAGGVAMRLFFGIIFSVLGSLGVAFAANYAMPAGLNEQWQIWIYALAFLICAAMIAALIGGKRQYELDDADNRPQQLQQRVEMMKRWHK